MVKVERWCKFFNFLLFCVVNRLQGCWYVISPARKETSYSDRRFWCSYIQFIIITGGILILFIYITRLASNKIFSPSNKIHWEVGRAKDLSAPRYFHDVHRRVKMKAGNVGHCLMHIWWRVWKVYYHSFMKYYWKYAYNLQIYVDMSCIFQWWTCLEFKCNLCSLFLFDIECCVWELCDQVFTAEKLLVWLLLLSITSPDHNNSG
jgi:hypothetical protein